MQPQSAIFCLIKLTWGDELNSCGVEWVKDKMVRRLRRLVGVRHDHYFCEIRENRKKWISRCISFFCVDDHSVITWKLIAHDCKQLNWLTPVLPNQTIVPRIQKYNKKYRLNPQWGMKKRVGRVTARFPSSFVQRTRVLKCWTISASIYIRLFTHPYDIHTRVKYLHYVGDMQERKKAKSTSILILRSCTVMNAANPIANHLLELRPLKE